MNIPIIDTHQHLVYADRWPYSWTTGIAELEGKNFHYSDYLNAINGTGIIASVFMETTPDDPHWNEETLFVDQLRREDGNLIQGLIANCRPEHGSAEFEAYLENISCFNLSGLRRFLHAAPEGTGESEQFVSNLRLLAKQSLSFDLCVFEHQLPLAKTIASSCPNVQFVLDHCGVPKIVGGDFKTWADAIKDLSEADNVACKVSGIMAYCNKGEATTANVRPYVEHCIECFGWERVLWGSDWPVLTMTSNIREWVASTLEIISQEDPENQGKLLQTNAKRIYRLERS